MIKSTVLLLIAVQIVTACIPNEGIDHVGFQTAEGWCEYHCNVAKTSQLHTDCAQNCVCTRNLLALDHTEEVHVVECSDGVSLDAIKDSKHTSFLFDFYARFEKAYATVVESPPGTCGSPGIAEKSVESATDHQPLLVNTTLQCMGQVEEAANTNYCPIITRDGSTVLVQVHVTQAQADRINALSCTHGIIKVHPVLKLAPLARSSRHLENYATTEKPVPNLLIKLEDSANREHILAELNHDIAEKTSKSNAVELHKEEAMLRMPSMTHVEVWALSLMVLVNHPLVEWVDIDYKVVSLSQLRHESTPHRRLDDFIDDVLQVGPAHEAGIVGSDVTVAVSDTGLYIDHDQFDQPERNIYDNVNGDARKVILYDTFGDNTDQSDTITCGHGTHVSAIIAGSSFSGDEGDWGIAPAAKIAFKDIGTQPDSCSSQRGCTVDLQTPFRASELFGSQIAAGAKIFSYSWGTLETDYSAQAQAIDAYLNQNEDVVVLVAAGNSGKQGPSTISSPAGAKNVITIGASLNSAESFGSNSCPQIRNEDSVAAFSSLGPTSDGRMKPDLVAPGERVSSAESLAPGSTEKTTRSCSLQGTSQSTPAVAGLAVMTYQWLRDGYWKNGEKDATFGMTFIPSALIKALLIHSSEGVQRRITTTSSSCTALQSTAESVEYPDFSQGYGRPRFPNIGAVDGSEQPVYFLPNSTMASPEISNNGLHEYNFTVRRGDIFRVTLVWTDTAGSLSAARMLQNDLDLTVKVAGSSKVFYALSGDGDFDRLNNVEMVQHTFEELEAEIQSGNGTNVTDELVVTALIHGFSIGTEIQRYSLVASSGSIGSVLHAGDPRQSSRIWQAWMTYVAIALGVGLLGFFIWSVVVSRSHATQREGGQQNFAAPPYVAYATAVDQQQPPEPQAMRHQCPHCLFNDPDPVVLVDHVSNLHPEINT